MLDSLACLTHPDALQQLAPKDAVVAPVLFMADNCVLLQGRAPRRHECII